MADETAVVKTYVPDQQKQEWQAHAERLGMSQSEFVRSMVQAGRRGFGGAATAVASSTTAGEPEQSGSPDETPGVEGLEDRVLDALRDGTQSWDEIVDAVVGDLEDELDQTLQELQAAGKIQYSGRAGGYDLVES